MSIKRTTGVVTLGAALLLSLTGCLNMDIDVAVKEDGKTASVAYQLGYDKNKIVKALSAGGEDRIDKKAICKEIEDSITQESPEYEMTWTESKDECLATYKAVTVQYDKNGLKPVKEANELLESKSISLEKIDEDTTKVALDFTSLSDLNSPASSATPEELFSSFNTTVSYPGKISEVNNGGVLSNGDKTVTWNLDSVLESIDAKEPLAATGELKSESLAPKVIIISLAALAGVVAAATAFVVMRRRKRSGRHAGEVNTDVAEKQ